MAAQQLAIDGGPKVHEEAFPSWPSFQKSTVKAAMKPLETGKVNYWTGTDGKVPGRKHASMGMEFEYEFAKWVGADYGISTSNGTSALHVALAGLGIGPGDEVICPSYSFIASSFCICQAGAVPVFADVQAGPKYCHTIDPADIEKKISRKTRAIIPVHLYGQVCQMDKIMRIAKKHNLFVIEDCAQAHGATFKGKTVGTMGHCNAFSFCQSKTFTTAGEGGMVTTDDEEVAWQCRSFRDHGYAVKERLDLLDMEAKLPYIHNMVGFNYRMTEMQSIVGLCELKRVDTWNLKNRRRNGAFLIEKLQGVDGIRVLPQHDSVVENGFWLFPIVLDIGKFSVDIAQFWHAVAAEGVPAGPVLWPQMYKEKAYREHNGFGRRNYPFKDPNTRKAAVDYKKCHCEKAAWLEDCTFFTAVHPVYTLSHMRAIVRAIKKVADAYRK